MKDEKKLLKSGDRVEVIKPKMTWNKKKVLAPVGAKATVIDDELPDIQGFGSDIRILIDGHGKGCWIYPNMLQKIEI
jgi:hypothetical protein